MSMFAGSFSNQYRSMLSLTLVNSYGLNGMGIDAVHLYHQMPEELFDEITHTCVLNACSHSGLVDQARTIFAKIPDKTDIISTTMVNSSSDQCQSLSFPIRSIALAVRHFSPKSDN
jgi:pentatricopeptide repeat protein